MKDDDVTILVAGDFVITEEYCNSNLFDPSITKLFQRADFRILNLEAPVTVNDSSNKITKTGPHLRTSKDAIAPSLDCLDANLVTLANNHILDYGEKGLLDTLTFCKAKKVSTVGADLNLPDASKPFRAEIKGLKISFINFAENEWANASESSGGAHPMDIIENVKQIKKERSTADKVIVIVHGGHEYYNLPSPRMQKQYRFYADNGADLVVGHHTHCISGNEIYNGTPIYYSLGNFLFTLPSKHNDWYNGLILEVNFDHEGKLSTCLHPVKQEEFTFRATLLEGKEKQDILQRIDIFNNIILNPKKLRASWNNYLSSQYETILSHWSPTTLFGSKYLNAILRRLKLSKYFISKKTLALHLNLMRCEAHFNLSSEILDQKINSKRK